MEKLQEVMKQIIGQFTATVGHPKRVETVNRMAQNAACFTERLNNIKTEMGMCQRAISRLGSELTDLELNFSHQSQRWKNKRNDIAYQFERRRKVENEMNLSDNRKLEELVAASTKVIKVKMPPLLNFS